MTALVVNGTPLEDHRSTLGLLVKREDLCCPPPGPPFSKVRGVVAHVQRRYDEGVRLFGVLDTAHSQAGHAVALACSALGAVCINFYPVRKSEAGADTKPQQAAATCLGATLYPLPAGRSAVLYHRARRELEAIDGGEGKAYLMPNALKLPETVEETAAEVVRTFEAASDEQREWMSHAPWLISASSGTIASGVLRGLELAGAWPMVFLVHMGYSRSEDAVMRYLAQSSGLLPRELGHVHVVDEGYEYADVARPSREDGRWMMPPWPSNPWYDLKAYRWWTLEGRRMWGGAVLWNVG